MKLANHILKKIVKVFAYFFLVFITIVFIILIYINTDAGKKQIKKQVVSYLQKKLQTNVSIGSIDYRLPKWIALNNVYLEDKNRDTLLYGENIMVDIAMIKLLKNDIQINKVALNNIKINVNRKPNDSAFNFNFIVNAFSSKTPNTSIKDTATLNLKLSALLLDKVHVQCKDSFIGSNFTVDVVQLKIAANSIKPDRNIFDIETIEGNGIKYVSHIYASGMGISSQVDSLSKQISPYPFFLKVQNIFLFDAAFSLNNSINESVIDNSSNKLLVKNIQYNAGSFKASIEDIMADKILITYKAPKAFNKSIPVPSATENRWQYAVSNIDITNCYLKYDDQNKLPIAGLDIAHLNATNINTNIKEVQFSKDNKTAKIDHFSFADKSGFVLDSTKAILHLTNKNLDIKNVFIKTKQSSILTTININFDSIAAISKYPKTVRINTLYNNSSIAINDIYLLAPTLKKSLPEAQFANQKISFNTAVSGNLEKLYLQYFQIKALSGSTIYASGILNNITDAKKVSAIINIKESKFYKKDLLKFVPLAQQDKLKDLPNFISLSGNIVGNKNDIVTTLNTKGNGFLFDGTVAINNITQPNNIQFSANINNANVTSKTLVPFLPASLLQNVALPENISIAGKLKGNLESIFTALNVNTSFGKMNINGFVKNFKIPQTALYDLKIQASKFLIGKVLIKDTSLGMVDGLITAKGKGFDYKTMQTVIKANFNTIGYNKYSYKNILVQANLNQGIVKSIGKIDDQNIKLDYDVTANVKNEYPTLTAVLKVDTVLLQPLNFTKDTLNFSLLSTIVIDNLQPRNLSASITMDSVQVQDHKSKYQLDSISLIASSQLGIDSITLQSPLLSINAGGAFDYDLLAPSLLQYVNNFYTVTTKKATVANLATQQFAISGILKQYPLLPVLVPALTYYKPISFGGTYASTQGDSALNFNINAPSIILGTNKVANAKIDLNSKNGQLNFNATVDTLITATNKLYATNINAIAAKDSVVINLLTKDKNNLNWFGLGGYAFVKNNTYTYHLKDSLILNYEKWTVASDNFVQYSPNGILVNDFVIKNDSASIAFASTQPIANSPIKIDINNFNLKSITSIINKDTLFVGGILGVKATISELDKPLPAFTGTAAINKLTYMQNEIGNLNLFAEKQQENNIAGELTLLGSGNDISLKGNYYLVNKDKQFDADLNINQLQLKTIQSFVPKVLENTTGAINGKINVQGKFAQPVWQGAINFDITNIGLVQLGTKLKIDKQKIVLNYPNISFPSFTVLDANNNALTLNGNIESKSMSDFNLDISIATKNFEVVNTPKKVNSQVYGYAAVDVAVSIKGTSAQPKIEGEIVVNDKSDVKLILPATNYEKNEGKEIVRFVDLDTFKIEQSKIGFEPAVELKSAFAQFLNYNLNIDISKNAALTILIDPVTGDEIKVQGDARLNVGVDPGGNLVLAGVYDLDNGYYDLHYQILQRKFNLVKGSTITFAGAPLNATVNITAAYIANSASKDLLSKEVANVSPTLANLFNQKIPFKVLLSLTGQLSKPTINFDIQLPEETKNINNELRTIIENKLLQIRNDPSAVNKQVFSLLLFNKFAGEQSSDFFKGNGGGFNDIARQSVSQFLSSALNEIAGDLIKGIDIDLNLNTFNDFSNGANTQRTDLNVAVSKSFANDRLTVSVGKNFGIEGQGAASVTSQANTGFKPDVTLSYKLTTDGKYMLRAYTKNQYEVTLDGYVVETGVSFLVTLSYDRFKELFNKKKK